MITESMQLLQSTYYYTNQEINNMYKLTHKNHPCSVWVRESLSNWQWLRKLTEELYKEYKFRYSDRVHKAGERLNDLVLPKLNDIGITKRPQCMPFEFQNMNVVDAYRQYYRVDKQHIIKYTRRNKPNWL